MSQAALPTTADLTAILPAAIVAPSNTLLQGFLDEAYEEWQELTGHKPFISSGVDTTRYYTPNNDGDHWLTLDTGLVALTSLKVDTITLTLNTDFWLKPDNAVVMGKPYTAIRFSDMLWKGAIATERAPVTIVGRFGWGTVFPQEVWEAIRQGAAWKLSQSMAGILEDGSADNVIKAKETPQARIEYAVDSSTGRALSRYSKGWERKFKETARKPKYCLHWGV